MSISCVDFASVTLPDFKSNRSESNIATTFHSLNLQKKKTQIQNEWKKKSRSSRAIPKVNAISQIDLCYFGGASIKLSIICHLSGLMRSQIELFSRQQQIHSAHTFITSCNRVPVWRILNQKHRQQTLPFLFSFKNKLNVYFVYLHDHKTVHFRLMWLIMSVKKAIIK